ncbi:MAG: peptidoglycan-binding protein [Anaerovorax sp.]
MPIIVPYVPEYITVHLGSPDSNARNVKVTFMDYIKNVASSEIYPTWGESAIFANVYAQTSFALNRIYTEFYPSKGYNFNITNTTALDQSFTPGRNIFSNIDKIVSNLFNDYIRKQGFIEPLAAKYCNGTTSTCQGLSQWGSEDLSRQGKSAYEILQTYYGKNIDIVSNAPVKGIIQSYSGTPLRKGSSGTDVKIIQTLLNRISQDYPIIPKINPVDAVFGENTENAVKVFQGIFNLTQDGIVGKATWYKIVSLYVGVKKLGELESEGQTIFGYSLEYPDALSAGDKGEKVIILQLFLSMLTQFYSDIPFLLITGIYDQGTINGVVAFQKNNNLPESGEVDDYTWNLIYECYRGIIDTVFGANLQRTINAEPFPGEILRIGSKGDSVRTLQQYLNTVSQTVTTISPVAVTGFFGDSTQNAVKEFQDWVALPQSGSVGRVTWNELINAFKDTVSTGTAAPRQYPGFVLKLGTVDPTIAGKE